MHSMINDPMSFELQKDAQNRHDSSDEIPHGLKFDHQYPL